MAREGRYESPLRRDQARLTRRRVLESAKKLLLDGGYSAMTIDAIARSAGVSVQTVYNSVGGKAEIVKAVYDVTLAGDDAPVPMAERPHFIALLEAADPRGCLGHYAAVSREVAERVSPLLRLVLAQAAAGEPALASFAATIEGERRTGTGIIATHIASRFGLGADLTPGRAGDILWALTGPELADRLVRQRGWTWDDYQGWLARAMTESLIGPWEPSLSRPPGDDGGPAGGRRRPGRRR